MPAASLESYAILRIDEIDLDNRIVHCLDKTGSNVQAFFRDSPGGTFYVPKQGEQWTAKRIGYSWHLENRLDSLDEHQGAAGSLSPGDLRLSAGQLQVTVEQIDLNGHPLGFTVYDSFLSGGTFNQVTLASSPVHKNSIMVFHNGSLLNPSTWTLGARVIRFVSPQSSGDIVVYYQTLASTFIDSSAVIGRGHIGVKRSWQKTIATTQGESLTVGHVP